MKDRHLLVFVSPPGGPDCQTEAQCSFVRPSVRPSVTIHVNAIFLKRNEPILMSVGTSGSRGNDHETINFGDQEIKF